MSAATVLVLNADYSLLEIVSWRQAASLLVAEKVRLVEGYAGRVLRSASMTMPFPAVVVRTTFVRARRRVRFSRKYILARDAHTCAYCGLRPRRASGTPDFDALTIDHVVPRSHARDGWVTLPWNGQRVRVTSWENVLTACEPCNTRKADQTPEQAGLVLRKYPKPPNALDLVWMNLFSYNIPDEWQIYLPKDSPWRDYWDVELSAE